MTHISPNVTHLLVTGRREIALRPDEVRILVMGEIRPKHVPQIERLGLRLPPRGTIPFVLKVRAGHGFQTHTAYCRRAYAH